MGKEEQQGSRQADHWKKKYYDSLDDIERKEKEWAQVEKILRLLASRLTLIAETEEASFRKKLDKLRSAIREDQDILRLQDLISDISSAIVTATESNKSSALPTHNPAMALMGLLDEIHVPKELQRQAKYLRKHLNKVAETSEIPSVIKDMTEFLSLIIDLMAKKRLQKLKDEGGQEKSGLSPGLFAKQTSQQTESVEEPESDAGTHESAISASERQDIGLAAETLIQLLEKLNLPPDLSAESDLIRSRLESCQDIDVLTQGADATATLVADMRARVQQEKKDLEDFLKQLTQRLQELDADIQATVRLRDHSIQDGLEMNAAVKQEVQNIEQSMTDAIDLEALKTAVQSRVIVIRNHVDRFLESESQRNDEATQLITNLTKQLQMTEQEVEALRELVEKEHKQALTDNLTGIPNRMAYDQRLNEEIARFKRYNSPFVVMIWDVDKFKSINDNYGHAAGDKVLKIIAKLFDKNIREADFVARFGGEEFVVVMPETSLQPAALVAEKLRAAVENTEFHFRKTRVVITASCGLTECRENDTAVTLFERADGALYKAKENGRNRYETG